MARVCERTWASLKSWSLCGIIFDPLCIDGSGAGEHRDLVELMAPARARTWASLKSWPLCVNALQPLSTYDPFAESWPGAH